MKKISGEALELFYRLDEKKYLVSTNLEIKRWLDRLQWSYSEEELQNFIDKIAAWYFVKFPDKYLCNRNVSTPTIGMNFNSLYQSLNTFETELMNFEGDEKDEKIKPMFFQYLLQLAGYKMIYSRDSIPEYGYIRVTNMFLEFNYFFNLDLDTKIYNSIMRRNYSLSRPENRELLRNFREIEKKQEKKKRRGLSRFLHR